MAHVAFPPALTVLIPSLPRQADVSMEACTLHAFIDTLEARWPGIALRLRTSPTLLREHIRIFVDGQAATLDHIVQPHSVVRILTAVSGG